MNILPIALTPKKVLLIGAGRAAAIKARSVLQSDSLLTVIAAQINEHYFDDFAVIVKKFELSDTTDFEIVINATGDRELSKLLSNERKKFGFLLNCVDQPEYCDFYFTANTRDHELCISVSSGGLSPTYAQYIRDLSSAIIPRKSADFYKQLSADRNAKCEKKGGVYLIGCGTGSIDNLTIGALRKIKQIDVALIDNLIGQEIIDLLPKTTQKINVGKQKNAHTMAQETINDLMLKYASKGLIVGRLKGGDPAVFGRVFEEASFLLERGVAVEMISGVSSVFAGCLAGGITPTLRDFSAGALIVSAHLRESQFNSDWIELIGKLPYTIIVLMAYSFTAKIVECALEQGVDMTIPAAFISNIDSPEQITVIGTIGSLNEMSKLCNKPAVLMIGSAISQAVKMPYSGKRIFCV
ncbi:hypothetical protein AGMMS50229_00110 [Campylobacterota bacterium]|nr:hypothetical protein AGMMS50229_00110 [Campylobacterota bacterium]